MRIRYFRLGRDNEAQETDRDQWAQGLTSASRVVALDTLGPVRVSTVFLGLDRGAGDPEIFETGVFLLRRRVPKRIEKLAGIPARYSTWAQAHAGHQVIVAVIREALAAVGLKS